MIASPTLPRDRQIIVHILWQDDVLVPLPSLKVTGRKPVYLYRQHGHIRVSHEPMIPVEFWWNEGRETGVAKARDLAAAGGPARSVPWFPYGFS